MSGSVPQGEHGSVGIAEMLGLVNATMVPESTKLPPPHQSRVLGLWPCKGHRAFLVNPAFGKVYLQEVSGVRVCLEPGRTGDLCPCVVSQWSLLPLQSVLPKDTVLATFLLL